MVGDDLILNGGSAGALVPEELEALGLKPPKLEPRKTDDRKTIMLGFDLETTGLEPLRHGIIQIGAALSRNLIFRLDVDPGNVEIDDEALTVNGFTRDRITELQKNGPGSHTASIAFDAWLVENLTIIFGGHQNLFNRLTGTKPDPINLDDFRFVPVGWNVGSFDFQFVKHHQPEIFRRLHYQTCDLNALCFGTGHSKEYKKAVKRLAVSVLGDDYKAHDAGWDAAEAIASFGLFDQIFHREEVPASWLMTLVDLTK